MDRNRVPKDLHSYSVYIDALSKSGKPWNAVRLFKEMSEKKEAACTAYPPAAAACPPAAAACTGPAADPAPRRARGVRRIAHFRGFLILRFLGFSNSDKGILPPREHGERPPRHEASDEVESRVRGVGSGAREPGTVAPAEDRVPDSDVRDEEGRGGGGGGEVEGVGEARRGEGEVEARVDAAPLAIDRRRHSVTTDESRTPTLAPDLRRLCSFGGRRPPLLAAFLYADADAAPTPPTPRPAAASFAAPRSSGGEALLRRRRPEPSSAAELGGRRGTHGAGLRGGLWASGSSGGAREVGVGRARGRPVHANASLSVAVAAEECSRHQDRQSIVLRHYEGTSFGTEGTTHLSRMSSFVEKCLQEQERGRIRHSGYSHDEPSSSSQMVMEISYLAAVGTEISNFRIEERLDSVHWRWNSDGRYTVKSTFSGLCDGVRGTPVLVRFGEFTYH
uniref:Pentatricopeptide repeat-containing protein n=1 Tax=Ananas comosus var. bracteatus TaxID=296719 RepID=A0A6V7PHJ6_ANACO|nr:unnamed protein product [Ananas comosus var. bracteatus]